MITMYEVGIAVPKGYVEAHCLQPKARYERVGYLVRCLDGESPRGTPF